MKITRRNLFLSIASVAVCSCSVWAYSQMTKDPNSPRAVLERVLAVNSLEEMAENKQLYTEKGYKFIQSLLTNSDKTISPGHDWEYEEPIVSERVYDLPVISPGPDGDSRMILRMVKMDGWKFDDVYYDRGRNTTLGIWGSEYAERPYWSIYSSVVRDIRSEFPFIKDLVKIGAGLF